MVNEDNDDGGGWNVGSANFKKHDATDHDDQANIQEYHRRHFYRKYI